MYRWSQSETPQRQPTHSIIVAQSTREYRHCIRASTNRRVWNRYRNKKTVLEPTQKNEGIKGPTNGESCRMTNDLEFQSPFFTVPYSNCVVVPPSCQQSARCIKTRTSNMLAVGGLYEYELLGILQSILHFRFVKRSVFHHVNELQRG